MTPIDQAYKFFSEGKWHQAHHAWVAIAKQTPDDPLALVGQGECLQQMKQFDAAEAILNEAKQRFPEHPRVMLRHAHMATLRGDWDEALRRWEAVLANQPWNPTAHVSIGVALREMGRLDEADQILRQVIEKYPDAQHGLINYAWNASRRRDWPESLRRWEAVRAKFGELHVYVRGRGLVLASMNLDRLDAVIEGQQGNTELSAQSTPTPRGQGTETSVALDDIKSLLERFQSLGEDCEFGFVQRHAGVEPLGLFRWAGTPVRNILTILKAGFAGVGEEAHTHLYAEKNGEFWVKDANYGLSTHTFVFQDAIADEQLARFRRQMVSRFRFLKNKVIEDLTSGEKIFVLKAEANPITDEMAKEIHDVMATYGPAWLLHVKKTRDPQLVGRVERVDDRLLVGYVDSSVAIDHPGWESVCKGAFGLYALRGGIRAA